jgi:1-acyl-sn-glycerol-3-phosphate acyltransferase
MSWLARRLYDGSHWVAFVFFTFACSIRVIGRRHMPKKGPVLVISNHQSMVDPVVMGMASRRYLSYLARSSLFNNRFFGAIIRTYGAVPIDRDFGKEGLQKVLELLEAGKAVLIFPEGERTHNGELQPFKAGISLLIKRVKAPIVPLAIAGAFNAWPRGKKLPRLAPLLMTPNPATLAISIGKPLDPAQFSDCNREEMLAKLFDAVAVEFAKANRIKRQRRPR